MKRSIFSTFTYALAICSQQLAAQQPVSETIEINHVKATVMANGSLFTDGQQGQFIPIQPGLAEKSLLRHAGLWVLGIDTAGNLQGATSRRQHTDFKTGLTASLQDDWNKIWHVTCSDINEHLADFQEDGIIDAPNARVYGFPGRANPYFEQYNPFSLPEWQALAWFSDKNIDNVYNPAHGEFPSIGLRYCPQDLYPEYQNWFGCYGQGAQGLSPISAIEVHTQVFAYKTTQNSRFNNAIFVHHKLINRHSVVLDSFYFGLYADFDIGNPNDDFAGCIPERNIVFGYNGDENDEDGFGANAPVMVMDILLSPFGQESELPLQHAMVLENTDNLSTQQLYNLLAGQLPNGNPAPNNGLMFPGRPDDANGLSEIAAGNTPGQREVVASFGPVTFKPGNVHNLFVAYYYVNTPGATSLQNVQTLFGAQDEIQSAFDNCFLTAEKTCDVQSGAIPAYPVSGLSIFPNPTANEFRIESTGRAFQHIQILDVLGRTLRQIDLETPLNGFSVPCHDLSPGAYVVRVENYAQPLIIQR